MLLKQAADIRFHPLGGKHAAAINHATLDGTSVADLSDQNRERILVTLPFDE